MPTPQRTNPELVAHLKHFEGWVDHPYKCAAGVLTIGYGHAFKPGENVPAKITPEWGEELLRADIEHHAGVAFRISPSLEQASPRRQAAIIDFVFNCGGGAYGGSTLKKKVDAGLWLEAAYQNGLWVKVKDPKTLKKYTSAWQVKRRAATSAWLAQG